MNKYWQVLFAPDGTGGVAPQGQQPGTIEQTDLPGPTPTPQDPPAPQDPMATPSAATKPSADPNAQPSKRPWFEQRIDMLTKEKHETAAKLAQAQQELINVQAQLKVRDMVAAAGQGAVAPGTPPVPGTPPAVIPPSTTGMTQQQFDEAVNRRAQELAAGMSGEALFTQQCNDIYSFGKQNYADFDDTLRTLQLRSGGLTREFLNDVVDLDNPSAVLYTLGKDPEKMTEILALPPKQRARELIRLDMAKPRASAAPAPITPQVGGGLVGEPSTRDANVPIAQWMEMRNKEVASQRR